MKLIISIILYLVNYHGLTSGRLNIKANLILWFSFFQQYDLETIKEMYLEKYDVSLKDALRDECSGDFKRLLLAICH